MSVFDPYSLYQRRYKRTHKGQILEQKPVEYKTPITKYEIPRSLSVLKTFNYTVLPPGESISINSNANYILTRYLHLGGDTLHDVNFTTDGINLKDEYPFNEILAEDVVEFRIRYFIDSLSFQNQFASGSNASLQICKGLHFNNTYNPLITGQNWYSYTPLNNTSCKALYGYNSYSNYTNVNYQNAYPQDGFYPLDYVTFNGVEHYASIQETGHPSSTENLILFTNSSLSSYIKQLHACLYILITFTYTHPLQ